MALAKDVVDTSSGVPAPGPEFGEGGGSGGPWGEDLPPVGAAGQSGRVPAQTPTAGPTTTGQQAADAATSALTTPAPTPPPAPSSGPENHDNQLPQPDLE